MMASLPMSLRSLPYSSLFRRSNLKKSCTTFTKSFSSKLIHKITSSSSNGICCAFSGQEQSIKNASSFVGRNNSELTQRDSGDTSERSRRQEYILSGPPLEHFIANSQQKDDTVAVVDESEHCVPYLSSESISGNGRKGDLTRLVLGKKTYQFLCYCS